MRPPNPHITWGESFWAVIGETRPNSTLSWPSMSRVRVGFDQPCGGGSDRTHWGPDQPMPGRNSRMFGSAEVGIAFANFGTVRPDSS